MTRRKVFFRADASVSIGYGHFVRSLALASMLKESFDCVFFTVEPSQYQVKELDGVCPYVSLNKESYFDDFLGYITGNEIVVLDNYFYSTEYQKKIKKKGCLLVCVDDKHDKHYVADVLINQFFEDASLFSVEPYTRLCLGLDWSMLRKSFLQQKKIKKEKGRWFLCFGGTDYNNMTKKYLSYLINDNRVKEISVVVGDAYMFFNTLPTHNKVIIRKNLSSEEMRNEMMISEYAIVPSSGVCIEAQSCGCKIVTGYFVDNQKDVSYEWGKKGYVYNLGDLNQFETTHFVDKIEAANFRFHYQFSSIQNRYIQLFSSIGKPNEQFPDMFTTEHYEFKNYTLLLEPDIYRLWKERNQLEIRKYMEQTESFSYESHLIYVENLKNKEDRKYYGVYYEGNLIGSQCLNPLNIKEGKGESGLFLFQEYQGRKLGKEMKREFILYMFEHDFLSVVIERVKLFNKRNQMINRELGFVEYDKDDVYVYMKLKKQ